MQNKGFLRTAPLLCGLLCGLSLSAQSTVLMKPVFEPDIEYKGQLLESRYNSAITKPDDILGFPVGNRVAEPAEISQAVEMWNEQSDRVHAVEYARSHEGRPLYAVFISSPENLKRLDAIKADINKLADPRSLNDRSAKKIIDDLPGVAWMAYSIHGNETSGADAAMAAIYHLAASQEQSVADLLDKLVIVIDPMMNPDGRARFAKSLEQYRGTAPNVDDQSLLHRGDWPFGRTNHYFFDLNRDFFYLTQPETQGRVKLINRWRPQLMIDGHEMGSQSTYLMGPPRQPLNANIPPFVQKWGLTFSKEQGAAFDDQGWRYFTGEWFENWYPGYSNYAEYRGSMHILYEQSRMAEDGVRRPEGTVQTYKESVHHQFVSTMANLTSLAQYSKEMYADYWQSRKQNVDPKGQFANRSYVVLANENKGRMKAFVERLQAQDIEVFVAQKSIKVSDAVNHLGDTLNSAEIPAGSLVIPNRQPEAPLISAILEFDAAIKTEVLVEERQRNLRDGSSIMYDTTAWNLTMMYGLPALTVPSELTSNLKPYADENETLREPRADALAWIVDGVDDRSVSFAARMMERGYQVRTIDKATVLSGESLSRGSVMVAKVDNPNTSDLLDSVKLTASELGLDVASIDSGYGDGVLPDWGGRHFNVLNRPQIGIISHGQFSSYDVGATWWTIDHYLGIRHSQLDVASLTNTDLRRYNTLVLPTGFGGLSKPQQDALKKWIEQGGTLIAHDRSAANLARKDGLSQVRQVADTFGDAEKYDLSVQREWLALQDDVDPSEIMQHAVSTELSYPWDNDVKRLKKDALKKRDQWQSLFMPRGAMVAGRVDQEHWLSFGVDETLPLLYSRMPVLMSDDSSRAVVRVGVLKDNGDNDADPSVIGWSTVPAGYDLSVRMSGLLWPEASQRIANSAYLTRESLGAGQIILFAGQPNFRGSTRGTNRLLLNALVYGSGLGTRPSINL
ncbi:peptidase [Alteromonadaceae bacterium M269]|nr:peptidase [Alteromonadaceae bacterium M269]